MRRGRLVGFGDLEERHDQTSSSARIASMSAASFGRNSSSRTSIRALAWAWSSSSVFASLLRGRRFAANLGASTASALTSRAATARPPLRAARAGAPGSRTERRVGLGERVDAVELEHIVRARDRIAQRLVSLVHVRRRLQRDAPLGVARRGEAVRMHFGLQLPVGAHRAPGSKRKRCGNPNSSK